MQRIVRPSLHGKLPRLPDLHTSSLKHKRPQIQAQADNPDNPDDIIRVTFSDLAKAEWHISRLH